MTDVDRSPEPHRARARGSVTEGERARVLALHAEGLSCRAIARTVGRSASTVSGIVETAGERFDTATTAEATAARVEDVRAARADLGEQLLDDARALRDRAWAPHVTKVGAPGGIEQRNLNLPPMRDVLAAYQAAGTAVREHLTLIRDIDSPTMAARRSGLVSLLDGLQALVAADAADRGKAP